MFAKLFATFVIVFFVFLNCKNSLNIYQNCNKNKIIWKTFFIIL